MNPEPSLWDPVALLLLVVTSLALLFLGALSLLAEACNPPP